MWRALIAVLALAFAGCAGIHSPATPQEIADKKFEPVPGKAVVYVVQNSIGSYGAGLRFDDGTQITTWPATFYRWVTTPGTHTIRSAEPNLSARITLNMQAGNIYFVQHSVRGLRGSTTDAALQQVNDQSGRRMVASAELCCPTR
jgi:hypothetical protein